MIWHVKTRRYHMKKEIIWREKTGWFGMSKLEDIPWKTRLFDIKTRWFCMSKLEDIPWKTRLFDIKTRWFGMSKLDDITWKNEIMLREKTMWFGIIYFALLHNFRTDRYWWNFVLYVLTHPSSLFLYKNARQISRQKITGSWYQNCVYLITD